MPTNRTKRRRALVALDAQHIEQFMTGMALLAGSGFAAGIPNGCSSWTDADHDQFKHNMAEGWRQHGAALLGWLRGENDRFNAVMAGLGGRARYDGMTPWALTELGEPQ